MMHKYLLLFFLTNSMADVQYYLDINGVSKHLSNDYDVDFNENNKGGGITLEQKEKNNLIRMLTAGGFKNSYNNNSFYAGGGLAKRFYMNGPKSPYLDIGGVAGGVTGYDKAVSPLVMPMMSLGMDDLYKLRLMYAPETKQNPATLMGNVGIRFK